MSTKSVPQFGVIGYPIGHSKSPKLHNAAFHHFGIPGRYEAIEVHPNDLVSLIDRLREPDRADSLRGVNVTVPHKQTVIPYLDEVSELSAMVGAVNTIFRKENGKLFGTNTDATGFTASLRQEFPQFDFAGKRAVIIGAGGAARAIAFSLGQNTLSHVAIINRTEATANEIQKLVLATNSYRKKMPNMLTDAFSPNSEGAFEALRNADLIVQTTSVGMSPNIAESPVTDFEWVNPSQLVVDIVYAPPETLFLRQCRERGAKTTNGVGMLIGQAANAFRLFISPTEMSADDSKKLYDVMRKAFYDQQ